MNVTWRRKTPGSAAATSGVERVLRNAMMLSSSILKGNLALLEASMAIYEVSVRTVVDTGA